MMTPDEMIAVLQAHKEGKQIQVSGVVGRTKWNATGHPVWDFSRYDYRVKPEPREFWLNIYPSTVGGAHSSREKADNAASNTRRECVHVREVLDNE